MMKGKKGIELSVNFLVTLILAIAVFGMAIYLASVIFGGGAGMTEKQFDDFDKQAGELACYAADNVCVHIKSETINRGKFKTLAVTIKNAFQEEKQFRTTIINTKYTDNAGQAKTSGFDKLLLYGMEDGRVEVLKRGEKKTMGIGVEVPKDAASGTYTLTVNVNYADPEATTWDTYGGKYSIFITVP